jgi:hypothetical protein
VVLFNDRFKSRSRGLHDDIHVLFKGIQSLAVLFFILPTVVVIGRAEGQTDEALRIAFVRYAFGLLMLAFSTLLFIMLRPRLIAKKQKIPLRAAI